MKQNIYDNETFFNEYKSLRDSGVSYNDFVEQPAIKSLLPSLHGKSVLDLGCGFGHFARLCIEQGASKVVGVDISSKMLEIARRENSHQKIEYICSAIEDVDWNGQKFDVIVSSLALHYINDYNSLIKTIYHLLEDNGEFIFSTEHPIVTANKGMNNWVKDSEGKKLHWAIDHYHDEGEREQHWVIDGVITYHRTVSTLINTLIMNGLTFNKMIEPQSTPEGLKQMPKLVSEKRRPSFLVIKSKK
jgi:ubiquinone/menaquinone biosynthesis C-methylase UbiE